MTYSSETTMDMGELMSNLSQILKGLSSNLAAIEKILADNGDSSLKLLQGIDVIDQVLLNLSIFLKQLSTSQIDQSKIDIIDALSLVTLAHLREQLVGTEPSAPPAKQEIDFF